MNSPFETLALDQDDDFAFWTNLLATDWTAPPAGMITMPVGEAIDMADVLTAPASDAPVIPEELLAPQPSFDIGPVSAPAVFSLPPVSVDVEWMLSDRTPQACIVA
jgi:hypothetical protein